MSSLRHESHDPVTAALASITSQVMEPVPDSG
jgi:hypothetical protein